MKLRNRWKCEAYRAFITCSVLSTNRFYFQRQDMHILKSCSIIISSKMVENVENQQEKCDFEKTQNNLLICEYRGNKLIVMSYKMWYILSVTV